MLERQGYFPLKDLAKTLGKEVIPQEEKGFLEKMMDFFK